LKKSGYTKNNYNEKVGPTYDLIRSNLLVDHQKRLWQLVWHATVIELSSLAGAFYLYESQHFALTIFALLGSSVFLALFCISISIYTKRCKLANDSLNLGASGIYLGVTGEPVSGPFRSGMEVAKFMPIAGIVLNILFLIYVLIMFCFCIASAECLGMGNG